MPKRATCPRRRAARSGGPFAMDDEDDVFDAYLSQSRAPRRSIDAETPRMSRPLKERWNRSCTSHFETSISMSDDNLM